ncbi:MAG: zinc-binding dehydrogenase [Candidatus Hydrogenedentota bacterium]
MKAAVIYQNGDLDCVTVDDIPAPEPAPHEVVLEVKAAALNHLDIWVRRGRPGHELSFPHPLGSDATGIVAEVGRDVHNVKPGDEVVVNPGLSCGLCEFCRRGDHSECLHFSIVGLASPGTFAERAAVPAVNVQPKPAYLTVEEAAALPLAHLTAWRMLMSRARFTPGESVLIHGIGGGLALAALQLAKLGNGEVIVTSSSEDKLGRAKELGADHTINYVTYPGVGQKVRDITKGRGVDIVIDSTGAETWDINFAAVRRGGRIVHCGVTTGAEASVNISALYWNHINVMGSTMGSEEDFRQLLAAASEAELRPVIDSVLPLDQARRAMGRMEEGRQFGKIVLVTESGAPLSSLTAAQEENPLPL